MKTERLSSLSPLFHLDRNPPEWHAANRTLFTVFPERSADPVRRHVQAHELENRLWKDASGVDAKNTRFSIIVPIFNEANFLPSMLGTLALSTIPADANVNIMLVTNACTDYEPTGTGGSESKSKAIVRNFLNTLGRVHVKSHTEEPLAEGFTDPLVDPEYLQTTRGGIRFVHINTETPGKSNALNIGNQIAVASGHPICMSLDANTFPALDGIAKLFGSAYQEIQVKDQGAAVVSGGYKDHAEEPEIIYGHTPRELLSGDLKSDSGYTNGAFMAWDTSWVSQLGGFDPALPDDMYIAMQAKFDNRPPVCLDDVNTWRYAPKTLEARKRMFVRYVRQNTAIMAAHPHLTDTVLSHAFFMRPRDERNDGLREWAGEDPRRADILDIVIGLYDEIFATAAELDQKEGPHPTRWEVVEGTK